MYQSLFGWPNWLFVFWSRTHRFWHCKLVMAFIMYTRFHEVSEVVITTTNSPTVVLSTTGFAVMRRTTMKIELELETTGR